MLAAIEATRPPLDRQKFFLGGATILLIAVGVRVLHLGRQSVWLDEAFTFHIVAASDWLAAALGNNSPPLFYGLLDVLTTVFGVEPWALRSLSAVAGAGAVAALIGWVGQLTGRRTALWSGLVLALSPIHVYYSQEARAYAVFLAFLILASSALTRALRRQRRSDWALFTLASALTIFSHHLAWPALLATILWLAPLHRPQAAATKGRPPWLTALACLLLAGVLFSPWALASSRAKHSATPGSGWVANVWQATPPALALPRSLEVTALGGETDRVPVQMKQMTRVALLPAVRTVGLVLWLGLALLPLLPERFDQRTSGGGLARRGLAVRLWGVLLTPLVILWIVSWSKPLYVVGRYDLTALPPFAVLAGLGLARLSRLGGSRLTLLIALPAFAILIWKLMLLAQAPPARPESQRTAEYLAASTTERDLVLFTGPRAFLELYELGRLGYRWNQEHCQSAEITFGCRILSPTWEPGHTSPPPASIPTGVALNRRFDALLASAPQRVWLVLGRYASSNGQLAAARFDLPILEELQRRGFRPVGSQPELGILIYRR